MKFLRIAACVAALVLIPGAAAAQKTQAQLQAEIASTFLDNTVGSITPAAVRSFLTDLVNSTTPVSGTSCPASALSLYQPFANTSGAPTGTTLNIFDGTQCVPWATLNQTAHTLTLTASTGTTQNPAILTTQNPTGIAASNFQLNQININSDTVNAGSNFGVGLNTVYNFGGSSMQGGREAIQGTADLITTSNASNPNRNYVGVAGVGASIVNDNGTGTTLGTAQGAVFGGNFVGSLFSGATNFLGVSGAEFNTFIQSGASSALKSIIQLTADPRDGVSGSQVDAMIWAYAGVTGLPNWTTGIQFGGVTGAGNWPIKSTGTIIKTTSSGSAANGIDFSNTTFSGNAFASSGFSVNGTGTVTSGGIGVASGAITLIGSSGGSLSLLASATANQLTITQGVTIGISGVAAGPLTLAGSSSGAVTIQPGAAAAGTYNFNLPTSAGSAGQVLISQGGGSSAMTWNPPGTGLTTTVASLPTCNAGLQGARHFVTDQNTAVAYHGAITGGGTSKQGVTCDGTSWYQD